MRVVPLNQNRKGATKNWRFQLTRSPLTFQPSQRAESGQLEAGTGDASAAAVNEPEIRRDPSAFLVTNKPVVFHSARERTDRTASRDAPASRYKLDSKVRDTSTRSPAQTYRLNLIQCFQHILM